MDSTISRLILVALLLTAVALSPLARADSGVVGEASFNPESGRLEVSIGLNVNDFRLVLANRFGQVVTLDNHSQDKIMTYVGERFALLDRHGEKARIDWLGHEISNGRAWVFFEMALPDSLEGSRFRNTLHFEIPEHQSNRLDFIIENNRLAMRFYRDDYEIPLDDITLGISH